MQAIVDQIKAKAQELLAAGTVDRVLGWEAGELAYDRTPAVFGSAEALDGLKYDLFCAANLSKYLIAETKKEGKVLALLKPCDTYSFNQLLHEHRIRREGVYVLGIPCRGKIDVRKLTAMGMEGITGVESMEELYEQMLAHRFSEALVQDIFFHNFHRFLGEAL